MDYVGINIEGPSSEGFFFYPVYRVHGDIAGALGGGSGKAPHIYPDRTVHDWTLTYDPAGADGRGQITVTLDDQTCTLDLEPGAKAAGATFDRFGICTPWIDGNSVTAFFDDIQYTYTPDPIPPHLQPTKENSLKSHTIPIAGIAAVLMFAAISHAEIKTIVGHHRNQDAAPDFKFTDVPAPSQSDAAAKATFTIVDGQRDRNGGDVDKLHDGKIPTEDDQPAQNFFFSMGADGGRILVDLGSVTTIKQVNTYSWHPDTRGPQVYALYAGEGDANGFNPQPKRGTDPQTCGWRRIAQVDTRPKEGNGGGQYGVSISDSAASSAGTAISCSTSIAPKPPTRSATRSTARSTWSSPMRPLLRLRRRSSRPERCAGKSSRPKAGYQITIDTTETPDLTEWAHKDLAPVVRQWYPKLVKMLPSEGYEAPRRVSVTFSANMQGVAATGGTRVRCAAGWFRQNLQGEAKGAVVHELAHVVQNYGQARRTNPNATRTPGWVVEGICDYIRWFLYEPADARRRHNRQEHFPGPV